MKATLAAAPKLSPKPDHVPDALVIDYDLYEPPPPIEEDIDEAQRRGELTMARERGSLKSAGAAKELLSTRASP